MRDRDQERVEHILGVRFNNTELLAMAFRHSSAVAAGHPEDSYEDLEFYGDKIIGYVIGGILRGYLLSEGGESRITQAFGRLTSRDTLGEIGERLGLFRFIELGISVSVPLASEFRHALVADVYEAVVAAIHEDQGFGAVTEFLDRTIVPRIGGVLAEPNLEDTKNQLQRLFKQSPGSLSYKLIKRRLPQHPRSYVCAVYYCGRLLAHGEGRTLKLAELDAAENALEMRRWRSSDEF